VPTPVQAQQNSYLLGNLVTYVRDISEGIGVQRKLSEIRRQGLQMVVGTFFKCQHCHIMDHDMDRMVRGHPCRSCETPSNGAQMVYSYRELDLVEMIQASFHAPTPNEQHLPGFDTAHREAAVLTYVCTLREVLLTSLIERWANARGMTCEEVERSLKSFRSFSSRRSRLIPSWSGLGWDAMVELEASEVNPDFLNLELAMNRAATARNKFLHEGRAYANIDRNLATLCLDSLFHLFAFYAALHNRYVRPLLTARDEHGKNPAC